MARTEIANKSKKVNKAIADARIIVSPIKLILDYGSMNPSTVSGLLANAIQEKKEIEIMKIPVSLLAVDVRYQTNVRTERELDYLVSKWDATKLLPLTVTPDLTRGCFHVLDGYGRVVSSQIVDKEKYKYLRCMVILNAPEDEEARLEYEAQQYAFQNRDVAKMKEVHKHGAYLVMHDEAAMILDSMQEKYGYTYAETKGHRCEGVLGSYNDCRNIIRTNGKECWEYIMSICKDSGFNSKSNGLGRRYLNALKDIWKFYPEKRKETCKYLGETLRKTEPVILQANAMSRYPLLGHEMAIRMYVEDMVTEKYKLPRNRICVGKQVIPA